jgi:geranylgeranyl pyrophosphate synthase
MTLLPAPAALLGHRSAVLGYLREISPSLHSVAGTIVREGAPVQEGRLLLRPSLVLWTCAACGGDERDALPVATAFELFDRFMLLHDELVEGRSEATMRWGLGQTLNAGDALYALAMRALALDVIDAPRRLRAAALVARAVLEAIEGRNIDVGRSARGGCDGFLAQVRSLRRRNAALTGTAMQAGAVVGGAPVRVARGLARAGRLLAAAATVEEAALAQRLAAKSVSVAERYLPNRTSLDEFAHLVRAAQRVA